MLGWLHLRIVSSHWSDYLSEFLKKVLICINLVAIFRTIVLFFIVIRENTSFWPLYHPNFLVHPLFIWALKNQHGKSFLKFNCWSNKAFKKCEDVIQIMTSVFFPAYQSMNHYEKFLKKRHEMNSKRKIHWHQLFFNVLNSSYGASRDVSRIDRREKNNDVIIWLRSS